MLAALVRLPASLMFEPTSHDLPTPLPFLTPAPTLRFIALVFPCHVRWDLPSCSSVVNVDADAFPVGRTGKRVGLPCVWRARPFLPY